MVDLGLIDSAEGVGAFAQELWVMNLNSLSSRAPANNVMYQHSQVWKRAESAFGTVGWTFSQDTEKRSETRWLAPLRNKQNGYILNLLAIIMSLVMVVVLWVIGLYTILLHVYDMNLWALVVLIIIWSKNVSRVTSRRPHLGTIPLEDKKREKQYHPSIND